MTHTLPSLARGGPLVALAVSVTLGGGVAAAQGNSPTQLRRFIDEQVGIQKLTVPARNEDLPQPRLPDGRPDPQFRTTEAKRYLGKLLFHDPARANRIIERYGGVVATSQTSSCGSCHLGEAASKAGSLLNFAAGGEGRGYTDAAGNFTARRRPRVDILPRLRTSPLFPGDALVDALPTLTDIYEHAIGTPARGRKLPDPGALLQTGRLDALDSVGRNAPSVIGFAFNTRLLQGGFAGEPDEAPGGLNPFGHGAQENVALLLLDAHRMLDDGAELHQSAVLQQIPAFVKLFQDAFPEEAAQAAGVGDINVLINNVTVLKATATFMRTVVTRNTPWDKFLAGDNRALTPAQRRGARLFFTPARAGGAGCYSCHSGPMLNKQFNDPDVAGVGRFVEENFYNLGLADHPLQALNRAARNDPNHRDDGRKEVTFKDSDAFKFRVLTLRQLKDGRFFFHNGSFARVKDVVQYFNAGIPQDAEAGAAPTLTSRFTNPRGPGSSRGLGLSEADVDDLTDFLENGLYDPAFVRFDPNSTTDTFEPNRRDLMYSVYRPDLKVADRELKDGFMPSGRPPNNDDPLSRRDQGLEFLDVTGQVRIALLDGNRGERGRGEGDASDSGDSREGRDWKGSQREQRVYRITNTSARPVDTHLLVIARGLSNQVEMDNASGRTSNGDPYRRMFLPDGVLAPGQSIDVTLRFRRHEKAPPVSFTLGLLSGQGNP